MIRRRTRLAAAVTAGVAIVPANAHAHLVETGFGPFYDGISHVALTPEDLVPTIALGLLAGLRGRPFGRRVIFVLPALWFAGGLLGLAAPSLAIPSVVASVSLLLVGGLVAADAKLPLGPVTLLTAALGLAHGVLNGAAMARADLGPLALLGIAGAVFVLVTLASAFVVSLRAPWMRVAIRVAGSWAVAIGMLMIGWAFRGTS